MGTGWTLPTALGRWLRRPDMEWEWFWDEVHEQIWLKEGEIWTCNQKVELRMRMRSNRLFCRVGRQDTAPSLLRPASVTVVDKESILLHDIGPELPTDPIVGALDFWERLFQHGGE